MRWNVATQFGVQAEQKVIISSMTNLLRLDSNPILDGITPMRLLLLR